MLKYILFFALFSLVLCDNCKLAPHSFDRCAATREEAIKCLFDTFGEGTGKDRYLDGKWIYKAWDNLFSAPMKLYAKNDPENVVGQCDVNKDGRVYREEMEQTQCQCIKDCTEALGSMTVCHMAKLKPNWKSL